MTVNTVVTVVTVVSSEKNHATSSKRKSRNLWKKSKILQCIEKQSQVSQKAALNTIFSSHFFVTKRLEAFLGLLVKTKMKAYAKLTVVMCCQIVTRKSVATSSGDFWRRPAPRYACGQDQEF